MFWVSLSALIISTLLLHRLVHESNCAPSDEETPSSEWLLSAALDSQSEKLRWSLKAQTTPGTNEKAITLIEGFLKTNMKDTKKSALRKKLEKFTAIKSMQEENPRNHVPELVNTALDVIGEFITIHTLKLSKPNFKEVYDMLKSRVEELRALQAMLASLKVPGGPEVSQVTVVPNPFAGVQNPKIIWPNRTVIQQEIKLQINLYEMYTKALGREVLLFRKINTLKEVMMEERSEIYEKLRELLEGQKYKELNVNERMEEFLKLLESSIKQKSEKFQQIKQFAETDKDAIEKEVTELGNAITTLESKVSETRKEIAENIRQSKLPGSTIPKPANGGVRFVAVPIEDEVDTYREIVEFILKNITEEGSVLKKYIFKASMANQRGINSGKWDALIGNRLIDWNTVKSDDKLVQSRLKEETKCVVEKINKFLDDNYSKPEFKGNQEISFKLNRLAIRVQELEEKLSVVKKVIHGLGRKIGL
ncbi:hypothetical protein Ddc_11303 [Ditylenchus destructor]|nr:hypothetical protein Ddc_11303 [Ditylenchus destructor]